MALNFGKGQRAIAFAPATAFPLDARSYFESYDLAVAAAAIAAEPGTDAAKNTEYYFGETLVVNEGGKATLYIIQPDKTLKEVGSVPVGDEKSIEVVDGQIKLKGFGSGYYQYNQKYKPAPVEGEDNRAEDEKDQYIFVESGFKAGLQPQVVAKASGEGFEIAWYEPNPTTVEGLQSQITALDGSVNNLANKVDTKADAALYQTKAISSISNLEASTVQGALEELVLDVVSNTSWITSHTTSFNTLANEVTAIDGRVSNIEGAYASTDYVNNAIGGLASVYETIANVDSKLANYYTKKQADEKHEEVVKVAEGKTRSYVCSIEKSGEIFDTQENSISYSGNTITDSFGNVINTADLRVGDILLFTDQDIPDRWVSYNILVSGTRYVTLVKLETRKIDLEPYATIDYVDEARDEVSQKLLNYISGSISTVDKLVLVAGSNQIKETEYTITNSFTTGNSSTIPTTSAVLDSISNAISDRATKKSVSDEASAREAADNALGERITAEESARVTSDQALGKRIDDETSARETLAGRVETLETTYATKSELDAEAKTRKDADDALDVRLDAVEAQLGISDESGNSLTEKVSEVIKEVWGVSDLSSFEFTASSRIDGHEDRIKEIERVSNTLATQDFVKEQIRSAEHVIDVKTNDTDFFEITKDPDDYVIINVKDDIESIIDDAVTAVVSGGQYVSATISDHGLTIDDSNLVNAINGLSRKFLSINTDYLASISISAYTDDYGLRTASMSITHGNGDTDGINLTEEIFGTPSIASAITSMVASTRVANNLYALGDNLGEGFASDAGLLLSNLVADGSASSLASKILTAATWVSSNKDVVSNLASNAVTSVQTSTLVMSHSSNKLIIDLPSVIWLDGGSASDTYEAEVAENNLFEE